MYEKSRSELLLVKDALEEEKGRYIILEEKCKGQCTKFQARIEDLEHQLVLKEAEIERRKREYRELKLQVRGNGSPSGRFTETSFETAEERE